MPELVQNNFGTFEDLGVPITNYIHNHVTVGQENGRPVSYAVIKGADDTSVFAVIDILTAKVVKTIPTPGVEGAWTIEIGTDGKVYFGSHYDGSLYQYTPGSDEIVNLGRLGSETHVFALVSGPEGKIYAGAYPNGSVYEYDPSSNEIKLLDRMHPEEKYVRALAYNPDLNVLYAGVGGAKAHLYKIDLDTGAKEELLSRYIPQDQSTYTMASSIGYALGKLFIRVNKPDQLIIVDTETDTVEYYDPSRWIGMGQNTLLVKPGDDSTIYFGGLKLFKYDLAEKTITDNGYPNDQRGVTFSDAQIMELNDPNWPGHTIVGAGEKGKIVLFNLDTGKMQNSVVDNYRSPVLIQSLSTGFDGNIYIGGYLGATGFTSYQPATGKFTDLHQFGQVEKVASVGDKLYIGTYGSSRIYEYDPTQPWSDANPRLVAKLISHGQDRPFALLGVDELNKLFIGSVADYGSHQGALAVYHPDDDSVQVYSEMVDNQGIISFAYHDGLIYGGTTIWGGLGTGGPIEEEAKLFIFDPETNTKVFEAAPAPGRKTVSGLMTDPDGFIWGVAEDVIFKFDPKTREFVYNESHLGRYKTGASTVWADAFLEYGTDGNIYGTNKRKHFFKINPQSLEFTTLHNRAGAYLTQDESGNLYLADGPYLKRYVIPTK